MQKKSHGFTLVEMIVALGIFSIVAVVALGALVKIISANKKAQSLQSAITNLNYALESISREVRVGSAYYCDTTEPVYYKAGFTPQSCPDGFSTGDTVYFAFKSARADEDDPTCKLLTVYRFSTEESAGIKKWRQEECDATPASGDYASIIDDNVVIDGYFARVTDSTTDAVSLATIRLSGYAGVREREKTYFDVQTSISPRVESDE